MKIKITLLILSVFQAFALFSSNKNLQTEILFIGSSYFNLNNLPDLVKNLCSVSGKDVYIDYNIPNGLYLSDHVLEETTLEKINSRDWDCVILQGVGRLAAYPGYYRDHRIFPAILNLKQIILQNCPDTKIIFCMPWAYEDGMTWLDGWDDTYADMQEHIYTNTL